MTYLQETFEAAIAEVDAWLLAAYAGSGRATRWQLQQHGYDATSVGWAIPLPDDVSLLVVVDRSFPYSRPSTAAFGRGAPRQGPHVEGNGRLCTFGDSARTDSADCIGVVRTYIDQSLRLLAEIGEGRHTSDFVIDFDAYWKRSLPKQVTVQTLLDWHALPQTALAWFGSKQIVVSDDEARLRTWLQNRKKDMSDLILEPALYIWLDRLPVPSEYPSTVASLRRLLRERCPGAVPLFDDLLATNSSRKTIVFGGASSPGEVGRGAFIVRPSKRRGAQMPIKGFRPGRAPPQIAQLANSVVRARVVPADAAGSRIPRDAFVRLRGSKVAILGCGSLGSGVAKLLVKSGCIDIKIFDPEVVGFENIGRHELGAADVGKNKAIALAADLRRHSPECKAEGFDKDWRDVLREDDSVFDDRDLIISATADWGSDCALVDVHSAGAASCPILFGWMERHACAAHALALDVDLQTYRRGFDGTGTILNPATGWWHEEHSPGCGGATSAYGAAELARAQSLVGALAIDILLEAAACPIWRVEVCTTQMLEALGGYWSTWFRTHAGDPGSGGRSFGLDWQMQ